MVADDNKPTTHGDQNSAGPFEQIVPAALDLGTSSDTAQPTQKKVSSNTAFVLGGLFSLLLCVVLAVIFLLPRLIGKPTVIPAETAASSPRPSPSKEAQRSPWQEAQLARERKAAQAVLEQLLERQFELEERSVQDWAAEDFQTAMQQARKGDELYRGQEFEAATAAYQTGLEALDKLLASTEATIERVLKDGAAALAAGHAEQATAVFELVLRIDPDNESAQAGLQRSAVLNEVLSLVAAAEALEKDEKLTPALQKFQQALKLDAQSDNAQQGFNRVQAKLQGNEFAQLMSSGYQALSAGQHTSAIKAFQSALKVKAGAPEAEEALTQARSQFGLQKISGSINSAKQLEQQEKWAAAVDKYTAALKVDKNLVAAQEKLQRAQTRARLDKALQNAIAKPERLSSNSIFQAARALLGKAQTINQPGPRLQQQLKTLEQQLRESQIPVAVQLESDNATDVTVLKVKHLGTLSQQQLSLKPGNYVAVGSREQYRDVRMEFRIEPGGQAENVVIKCVEKI
ncbi:MAG: hypothetical protein ACR2PS_13585 [Pseudomonadales bacterium]